LIVVNPYGTLLKVALLCLASGALWSAAAASAIYLGATLLPPKIRPGQVWVEWRRRRVLWGMSLLAGLFTTWWAADLIGHRVGLVDLYWLTRRDEILWIGRLGGLCGYLLVLLLVVVAG